MPTPTSLILTAVVVALAIYTVRHFIQGRRRSADFDAGTVSQNWLTEHRAGKQNDRFS
jgi:multisubunit Na+/H+ antiporter MnhC subunit